MQIVTALPRYSDGEINRALIQEIKTGFQLAKAIEDKEEILAAKQAEEARGHKTIAGLGKQLWTMPEDAYFRMVRKYGHAEVHSKEFARYMNKRMPHLCSHKA